MSQQVKCLVRLQTVDNTTHSFVISADGTLEPDHSDNCKSFSTEQELNACLSEIHKELSQQQRPFYVGITAGLIPLKGD